MSLCTYCTEQGFGGCEAVRLGDPFTCDLQIYEREGEPDES